MNEARDLQDEIKRLKERDQIKHKEVCEAIRYNQLSQINPQLKNKYNFRIQNIE